MNKERVIIALHDQFSGSSLHDFVLRHDWQPTTEFHVAHVIEPSSPPRWRDPAWEAAMLRVRESASALVGEFAEQIRDVAPDLCVTEHVLEGRAADELVRLAQNQTASLIIMGCRGRRGLKRLLLGSVSGSVANRAPCSVVILKKNHLAFARRAQG